VAGNSNSGRRKTPVSIHLLRNTFRADRHGEMQPAASKGVPTPPNPLVGAARREWDRAIDRLRAAGTLSVVDDGVVYEFCCLRGETESLRKDHIRQRKIAKKLLAAAETLAGQDLVGVISKIASLEQLIGRHVGAMRLQHLAARAFLSELGLTPSSRGRVSVVGGGAEVPRSKVDAFRKSKGSKP